MCQNLLFAYGHLIVIAPFAENIPFSTELLLYPSVFLSGKKKYLRVFIWFTPVILKGKCLKFKLHI